MSGSLAARGRAPFDRRRAGVLLHMSSLAVASGAGPMGRAALDWMQWMDEAGFTVWQMLPIHPVHQQGSPYQPLSVFAGGEHLLCPEQLATQTAYTSTVDQGPVTLRKIAAVWLANADSTAAEDFRDFCRRQACWLEDWACWRLLRSRFADADWRSWPAAWRCASQAKARLQYDSASELQVERALQYLFERQWQSLRQHARQRNISLFGDLPIYPSLDSAEVWAEPELFRLDSEGQALEAGGAPPDHFNAEGQHWGGAVHEWPRQASDGFRWWQRRLRRQMELFDLLRMDHFRGFEAYWSIPATADSPAAGAWRPGPGAAFFEVLAGLQALLVAEDLGDISPEVHALRARFGLPSCRVLQFAFDGNPNNPHLPQHYPAECVAYSGTHDNDTLLGWWRALPDAVHADAARRWPGRELPQGLLDVTLESAALLAMLPAQDLLGLGSEARLNVPGTIDGNWHWRLPPVGISAKLAEQWRHRLAAAGRL